MPPSPSQGITRRDLLKKGAALGGAVVWVTPIVQSVGMGRAFAQATSPCTPPISYIAMNVTCPGGQFFIKWEGDEFLDFEYDPGQMCRQSFSHKRTPPLRDSLRFLSRSPCRPRLGFKAVSSRKPFLVRNFLPTYGSGWRIGSIKPQSDE